MPYRFRDDIATADVAFDAWGESAEELFVSCSAALLRTMVNDPELVERRSELQIRLEHEEFDLLLFNFLQELVYYKDARRLLLHVGNVSIRGEAGSYTLEAIATGEEIAAGRHRLLVDVKAVTLHRFKVIQEDRKYSATVVLDV